MMWRCLFAFAIIQVVFSETILNSTFYLSTDDDVDVQSFEIPIDKYNGSVTTTVTPMYFDLLLCITWLVPAEAPVTVNLSTVWPAVCDYTQVIPSSADPQIKFSFNSPLRTGVNYYSLTAFDLDSVGDAPISITVDTVLCDENNTFGPDCANYTNINYNDEVVVIDSISTQFMLPTFVNSAKYVQNLNFNPKNNLTGANISYRLSGPIVPGVKPDGVCADLTKGCTIITPPMTNSNSFWIITVFATNLSFSVTPTLCNNNLGSSCKITNLNDGTKLKNSVTQYSGAQYFSFPGPIFDVAVGGLDGFTQTPLAPNMTVQLDNVPTIALSSGINAKSNRLTINMTGSSVILPESRFIVFVNAKGSFGIWIPTDNTTCPNNCSGVGTCEDYVCNCSTKSKPEYNGLGCEHEVKSFTIEYVILIAVGGLLVLSIVIGVPVYCWMNRHSDYETVA